jgi:tRNA(Ile)-lysidine synthase
MAAIAEKFRQFFVKEGIAGRIAVAVSGGIDSTALLLLLHDLRGEHLELVAAHINHHLRGVDSEGDESFVRDLCADLRIPLHVADGSLDPELVRERGIEAAAREIRYAQLRAIRDETGARFVATAHQKNDQAETVLMRLLTGSGISGLRGIHPVRDDGFIRPLLNVTRDELGAFLRERGVEARIDRSNEELRFLRNRVRALLREIGGVDSLAAIAEQARAQWPLLERAIDEAERTCTSFDEQETRFLRWPDDLWLRGALLQRHIRRLDLRARDFDAMRIATTAGTVRRMSVTKNLELVRKGDGICILRKPPEPMAEFELRLTEDSPLRIPLLGMTIHLARHPGRTASRGQLIELPEAAAELIVRNRRRGDRFHPLGRKAPKKLKDVLIDRRIDVDIRDRLPLLVWNGEIVWIAGVGVSERYRVTGAGGMVYEVWTDDRDQADLQR